MSFDQSEFVVNYIQLLYLSKEKLRNVFLSGAHNPQEGLSSSGSETNNRSINFLLFTAFIAVLGML
jgi:hypothetical protein